MFLKVSNIHKNQSLHQQRGSSLVIAIFIIVVISMLGAALVKMIRSSSDSIVYEVLGTRAYNAAQIGLQWQLQQLFPLDNNVQLTCAAVFTVPPNIDTTAGLENCDIISPISCTDSEVLGTRYYTVKSTGQCSIAGILTSRTLEVQARAL
jgi:MSHA biogenesis protein MshP